MAGIKTGNLFTCDFSSKEELLADLKRYNQLFVPRGLFLIPLKLMGNKALLYLFRKDMLAHDLALSETSDLLESFGYKDADYRTCLSKLVRKLKTMEGFPHEIGLFLSYPIEDVKGFIENHAENFKMVGYWKVYGDENAARKKFSQYDRCTSEYRRRIKKGTALESLVI